MEEIMYYLLTVYLIIINLVEILLMYVDKRRAISNKWRIPEKTLLLVAFAGGSFGGFAGMKLFRHKIRNVKFRIGLPVMLAIHIVAVVLLTNRLF